METNKNFISDEAYKEIKAKTVVVCTDGIILRKNANVLLGMRNIEPVKGLPWIIGGRVPKGETMSAAVKSKVLQETGLEVADAGLVGVYRRVYRTGEDRDDLVHTHLVIEIGGNLRPDFQNTKFVEIPGYGKEFHKLHERVKQPIIDSEIFEDHKKIAKALVAKVDHLKDPSECHPTVNRLEERYRSLKRYITQFHDDVTPQ
jgi:ADP-ribose pyrophosphatase YjhB (NUDIX family)